MNIKQISCSGNYVYVLTERNTIIKLGGGDFHLGYEMGIKKNEEIFHPQKCDSKRAGIIKLDN